MPSHLPAHGIFPYQDCYINMVKIVTLKVEQLLCYLVAKIVNKEVIRLDFRFFSANFPWHALNGNFSADPAPQ